MKSSLSLAALLLLAGTAGSVADTVPYTVELNGLTSLFGEHMAFLLLHRQGPAEPVSFVLLEGQSQFGIKLLAVDVQNQRAKIEQLGQTQYLRLGAAPDLALISTPMAKPGSHALRKLSPQDQQQLDNFLNSDPSVQTIQSGGPIPVPIYPGIAGAPGNVSGNSSTSTSPDNSVANNANANANQSSSSSTATDASASSGASSSSNSGLSTATDTTPDYTKQPWYKTSRDIELTRLATAAQVADGEQNPLPRTPLTPANTPPDLVGPETFFANHIPGFVYGGSPYAVDENGNPVP